MAIHQSMSGRAAQKRIDAEAQNYGLMLRDEHWTLQHAHDVLKGDRLNLFQIAGLAKAIACFQCDEDAPALQIAE